MNKQLTAVLAAGLMIGSGAAYAQQQSPWYIGGGLGQSKTKLNNSDFTTGVAGVSESKDETGNGFKVFGGYQFTPNWGAELGYNVFGDAKATGSITGGSFEGKVETNSWTLAATGTLPLGNNFALQGRLGGTRNEMKTNITSSGNLAAIGSMSAKKTKYDLYYGIGGQYNLNKNWGFRLDYDNYGKFGGSGDNDPGRADVDMLSINVVFRFN